MRRFWERRAREDPFFFVDNRQAYRRPDLARFWEQGEEDLDEFLDRLGLRVEPTDSVVDLGCGVGRLTRTLAARAAEVQAIDISPRMVELARRHNAELTNVSWTVGDGRSLAGIGDASVDAVVCHVVLQHIPDPAVILGYVREMGRVLRPGSWAAFQVSNDPGVHRRPSAARRMASAARVAVRRGPRGQGHPAWRGSAVSLAELHDAAGVAGLAVERVVGAGTQFCLVRARRLPD